MHDAGMARYQGIRTSTETRPGSMTSESGSISRSLITGGHYEESRAGGQTSLAMRGIAQADASPRPVCGLCASDGWRHEDAGVRVVERLLGDELVHRVRSPPLVGDLRVGEVVDVGVPGVL